MTTRGTSVILIPDTLSLSQKHIREDSMNTFLSSLKIPPKFQSFFQAYTDSPQTPEKRKKLRKEVNVYKKASHKPYRSTLCAKNAEGLRDPKSAQATICFIHGLRGYAGLYQGYQEYQSTVNGRNGIILDFPGHGKNPGEPCRIHHVKYFEECVGSAVVEARSLNPDIPIILITFSMGGLITLQYLFDSAPHHIRRHIAGIACLGVPLEVGQDVPKWKLFLAPLIAWCLPWWKQKELCIGKDNINHDPVVVKEVMEDPMIYKGPLPAWTAYSIRKMTQNVYSLLKNKGYRNLGIPMLFLRGELDTTAEREPYNRARIPVIDIAGFKHEILKGAGSDNVRNILDSWIEKVVLPSWNLSKQKNNLSKKFFKELSGVREVIMA